MSTIDSVELFAGNSGISSIEDEEDYETPETFHACAKLLVVCVIIGVAIFVLVDAFSYEYVGTAFSAFLQWVEQHPNYGLLAVILVEILCTVFFITSSVMSLGAGFIFGRVYGIKMGVMLATTAIFIGCVIGSLICFLLGRYVLRDWVDSISENYTIFRAVNRALRNHGLKINLLLRLSILLPMNILDYLLGGTAVPLWIYTLSLIAILPGTIIYTFLGATASTLLTTDSSRESTILLLIGVSFALTAICMASFYSKMELEKILQEEERMQLDTIREDELDDDDNDGDGDGNTLPIRNSVV